MSKRYPDTIILKCRHLYMTENWSYKRISEFYDGEPSWQTIRNWANELDDDGKTWADHRKDLFESQMHQISPQEIESLYMKRIYEALHDPEFSSKTADALAKLQSQFEKITDPSRNIPVIYRFLEDLTSFMKKYYPHLLTAEFLELISEFKNNLRKQMLSKFD